MLNTSKSSKSLLAKLLASENITIEHRKVPTAYFDTKSRVMVLPIWKTMSEFLNDLLFLLVLFRGRTQCLIACAVLGPV